MIRTLSLNKGKNRIHESGRKERRKEQLQKAWEWGVLSFFSLINGCTENHQTDGGPFALVKLTNSPGKYL